MMPESKKLELDVAILGAGFAGIYCGKQLEKRLDSTRAERCGIISEHNYMVFQPLLAEVVGASISPRHVVNPVRMLCPGIGSYRGKVDRIDLKNREVSIVSGDFSQNFTIGFRHLVLSMGAEIDLSRVPGMPEHAHLMQNVGDAMILRARILSRLEEANLEMDPWRRRCLLTFVVVGGGYSGVETAGEMVDMLDSMIEHYSRISRDELRVILVHSRDYILPTMDRELSAYAMEKLRSRGLELVLGHRVKSITSTRVYLDDGSSIDTNTVISTVGNAPHRVISRLIREYDLPNERSRLVVDSHLRVEGYDFLWAAGDCAMVPKHEEDGYCPPTAQFAMRQGALMGNNIAASLKGTPTRPFKFRGLGELASIGHRTAVADIMGFKISGFLAWFMWRTIYLSKLPGWERRLRVVIDWTLDLFFPRDTTLLNPRYTKLQTDVYLESGDCLFRSGEPAFSLYILKSGSIRLMEGDEVVRTIHAGEYFGERALLHEGRYVYSAVASEPSQLISVSGQTFLPLIKGSENLSLLFARTSAQADPGEEMTAIASSIPDGYMENPVSDHMIREVVSLEKSLTIREALKLIRQHRFSIYPVTDEAGKLVTSISEDDLFNALKREGITLESPIMQCDSCNVPQCRPGDPISSAIEKMIFSGRTKCYILEEGGVLSGVIGLLDLIDA